MSQKKKMYNCLTKILSSVMHSSVFNTDNYKKMSPEQQICILEISEGSWDFEDWNNDAENSALHHRNKLHFKIEIN